MEVDVGNSTVEKPATEKKLLKDILDARQKSDVDILLVFVEIFKRLEVLEERLEKGKK